jgi:ribulose-5-phosphate 4-epimerase/fuculose-1-phosphate aldolase
MAEELYVGPRFETVFISSEVPDVEGVEKLMEWCAFFHKHGLAPSHESGTAGNLSFRIKEGENAFCITGAGLQAKCKLQNSDFVEVCECDAAVMKVFAKGTRLPSSESLMHFAVYEKMPHIHAVFHGHNEGLLKQATQLGIPITEVECDYGTPELVESINSMLGKHSFFIIKNHGFLALGTDMKEAGNLAYAYVSKTKMEDMDSE